MADDKPSEGPVGFRKATKRRADTTRKRDEEPTVVVEKKTNEEEDEDGDKIEKSEDEATDSSGEGKVVKPSKSILATKRLKRNPLMASSARKRNVQNEDDDSTSDSAEDSNDSEEEERKKALDIDFKYQSSNTGESVGPKDMGATARSEVDTEHEKDYRAQRERVQKELKEAEDQAGTSNQKVYRGMKMYGSRATIDSKKGETVSTGLNRYGPIRAQQFMRATVRWDYAPDICKDYKETGFCTFGDSCKFLHDRSDYKHGWEIERDWQKEQEAKRLQQNNPEEDYTIHSDED